MLLLCIVTVVLIIFFAPSLIKGAGNALITSIDNSAAQGVAQLIPHAQGNGADLQVKLDGLAANTNYYVSLDQGQCGGTALFNVGKISTDANGSSTATLSLNDLRNALSQGLWLDVHQGTDASGQSIACGQILSNNSAIAQFGSTPTSTSTDTPTPIPTTAVSNIPTTSPVNSLDTSVSDRAALHGVSSFPATGVAPATNNSYDNYTFPRKY
ncbi:MAG: hypothetical protein NVSMB27_03220 [Ktedonobacteraceae bacterium]